MPRDNRKKRNLNNFYIRRIAKNLTRRQISACMGVMSVLFCVALALSYLRSYYEQGATDSLRSLITGLLIALLSLIVTAPVNVGARGVFCDIAAGRETKTTKALAWYGDGKKLSGSILLTLMQTLMALLALALLGGLALAIAAQLDPMFFGALIYGNVFWLMLSPGKFYLFLLAIIGPVYLLTARFMPAAYLLAEQPEKGAMACMKESFRLLKGFYWKYVGLQLLALLQLVGYALMASLFCMLIFRGDTVSAVVYAVILVEAIIYFSIMPQLGVSTSLFLNDVRVRNSGPQATETHESDML